MLPNFLCIGAMKAGTSWLYHNIKHHPDVKMPPYKEITYFGGLSNRPAITEILVKDPYMSRRVRLVLTYYMPRCPRSVVWFTRYLLLPRSDKWYASLFARKKGKISGDISPTYATLDSEDVAKAHALLPNAKIIYIIRNPIHRTWSQVAMHFEVWFNGLENADDKALDDFFAAGGGMRASDYLRFLKVWEDYYDKHQIKVAFLDRIATDPGGFLKDIYRFLDLEPSDQFVPDKVHDRQNAREYPPIPDQFARHLATHFQGQVEALHQRFNNEYTADWLNYTKQYL